jgi:hypothetical protein
VLVSEYASTKDDCENPECWSHRNRTVSKSTTDGQQVNDGYAGMCCLERLIDTEYECTGFGERQYVFAVRFKYAGESQVCHPKVIFCKHNLWRSGSTICPLLPSYPRLKSHCGRLSISQTPETPSIHRMSCASDVSNLCSHAGNTLSGM